MKGIEALRAKWLESGGIWREPKYKPTDLSLDQQLKQIPRELPVGILKNKPAF
jgi:hypothetical protein